MRQQRHSIIMHEGREEEHTGAAEAEAVAVVVVPDAERAVAAARDEPLACVVEHEARHRRLPVRVVELEHAAPRLQIPHAHQLEYYSTRRLVYVQLVLYSRMPPYVLYSYCRLWLYLIRIIVSVSICKERNIPNLQMRRLCV